MGVFSNSCALRAHNRITYCTPSITDDSFLISRQPCQQSWPLHLEYCTNSNSNTQLHITYPHIHLSPTYHLAITYLLLIPIRYVTQQISSPLWSVPLHRELLLVLESQKIWPKLEPRKRLGSLK